jgi:hypothetical protein
LELRRHLYATLMELVALRAEDRFGLDVMFHEAQMNACYAQDAIELFIQEGRFASGASELARCPGLGAAFETLNRYVLRCPTSRLDALPWRDVERRLRRLRMQPPNLPPTLSAETLRQELLRALTVEDEALVRQATRLREKEGQGAEATSEPDDAEPCD